MKTMMRIPVLHAALAAVVLLLMVDWPKAGQPEAKAPVTRVAVELVDGSRVLGEPTEAEVKIVTSLGEIKVQMVNVTKLVLNEDHHTAEVSLVNGDHLSGTLKMEAFGLRAVWGKVDFPLQHVRAFTVIGRANTWSARDDFSTASNPNGPWCYGWVAGEAGAKFTPCRLPFNDNGHDGWKLDTDPGGIWINHGSQAIYGVQPGEVSQHAGGNGEHSVLRWQAPKSCTVHVKGAFGAGDSGAVNVTVLHNTTVLFKAAETKKDEPFDLEVEVKAGDTIDFDVGAGSEGFAYGNTPIDVVISVK